MTDRSVSEIFDEWYNRRNGVLRALTTEYISCLSVLPHFLSVHVLVSIHLSVAVHLIVKVFVCSETSMVLGKSVRLLTKCLLLSLNLATESTVPEIHSMYIFSFLLNYRTISVVEIFLVSICRSSF